MLFVLFHVGADRYAIEARPLVEVLPLVALKHVPGAPAALAGLFDFQGVAVPALDLGTIMLQRPSPVRRDTRLILVRYATPSRPRLLGLIAEHVTATLRREPDDFKPSGVSPGAARYLGLVTRDARGLIQRVDVESLVPAEVRGRLFPEEGASP